MRQLHFFFLLFLSSPAWSQSLLDQYITKVNSFTTTRLQEKVYVHVDRTFYAAGEKAWFKIYLVDGFVHQPLNSSKVAYLEILDDTNNPVIQTKINLEEGAGYGSVVIPATLNSGNYLIRGYTQWMKNFSPDLYFQQSITIVNVFRSLYEKQSITDSKLDVRFFPEGGQLVDGLRSKIACRVVNGTGKGVDYTGSILSSKGDTIVRFSSMKFGIGNFMFTPLLAEQYKVIIREASGRITQSTLPVIQSSGYTLQVSDTSQNRISVKIRGKGKEINSPLLYFIAHTRQVIKVASVNYLKDGEANFTFLKSELGEGISHLTVFSSEFKPVCQRLVFVSPKKSTLVKIATDQYEYGTRSKVNLSLQSDKISDTGFNLSLSVFKYDSLQQITATDIQTYLWLSSELKGSIESPEYYFSNDADVVAASDNLMLTHGWSRFRWEDIKSDEDFIQYLPEYRGHILSGKVVNRTNGKSLAGIATYLSAPGKKIQLFESVSDTKGNVYFEVADFFGKKKVIAQTSRADSIAKIELASPFSKEFSSHVIPPFSLTPNLSKQLTARSISLQIADVYPRPQSQSPFILSDSLAFYGQPPEQYKLDDYTRFPVMEEIMREYVKGVRLRKKDDKYIFKVVNTTLNTVYDNEPLVMLDGVPVFDTDKLMQIDPLKVMHLDVVAGKYFLGSLAFEGIVSFKTYAGDLGGFQLSPENLILDYEALQSKSEFFSPRYESKQQQNRLPDARHLLFWMPDLALTQANKIIDFYTSDQPGTYQAVIQGISRAGEPVFGSYSFTVKLSH
jgi:hypothetical protein